jgi:hypothetical protein
MRYPLASIWVSALVLAAVGYHHAAGSPPTPPRTPLSNRWRNSDHDRRTTHHRLYDLR